MSRWLSGFPVNDGLPICLCRHTQRRRTCTDGLRVRIDSGCAAFPPTRPAGHTLGISMQTEEKGRQWGHQSVRPLDDERMRILTFRGACLALNAELKDEGSRYWRQRRGGVYRSCLNENGFLNEIERAHSLPL
jgi:hypothetical protein